MRLRSLFTAIASIIIISLPAFAAITGTVMTSDGQAVSGAKISLFQPETAEARRARVVSKTPARTPLVIATSDSKGNFSVDSPKLPVIDLGVDASGFAPEGERVLPDEELGAIPVFPAAMQKGTITAAGKPVAGAVVTFSGPTDYEAVTDAKGNYSVPDPAKWANRMTVIHAEYAIVEEGMGPFARNKKDVNEALDPGTTISGRVLAADGTTPVANAAIFVDGWQLATSDVDGKFTIAHAAKKWGEVEARIGDRVGARAHANGDLAIKLGKAAAVTGIVTDSKTNAPLAGAEVRLYRSGGMAFFPMPGMMPALSTFTDAKGQYALTPVAAGLYQINPTRPGYFTPNTNVAITAGQAVQKPLYSNALARVVGSVVDDAKQAVAGARISARPAERDQATMIIGRAMRGTGPEAPAYSGPDGRFVMRSVLTDAEVQIDAAKKGYPAGRSATLKLAPGERKAGVVITIPRGIALTGKVIDHNAKPVSGVGVETVESSRDAGFGGMRRLVVNAMRQDRNDEIVRTAADGTFTIRVKEGTYDVVFKRDGFATKTLRATAVNTATKPVQVTLDPGVEITGRVTRGGVGVEGVTINAMSMDGAASATTAADGTFQLEDLTPGQMILNAMKPDEFIQQTRPVTAPAENVNIEVPPGGRITGHVLDKNSHAPVTTFQAGLSLSRSAGGMSIQLPPLLKSFTNDDGSFTLENVPTGPAQVVVSAPGYTTAHKSGINVEVGKTVPDIEVDLDTGVKLTGRVTSSDGTPLSGVAVREDTAGGGLMRMIAANTAPTTVTDPNGEYELDALEAGDKTFTFARQGYLTQSRNITLSGSSSQLDVQLSTGLRLTGTVVSDAGAPVPDASVMAMSAANSGFGGNRVSTDANGAFEMEGLAPGHYTLTAAKPGYANGVVSDFDVAAGVPARITLKTGATITGRVVGLTADELQNATVFASGGNTGMSAPVDGSGNYRIEGAPTGTVRLSARTGQMFGATSKSSPQQSVQVDPGSTVTVDLEFKSATVITGHITRDGQPLGNATVAFMPKAAQASTSASGQTDGTGNYQVTGLDDASYTVQIMDFQRTTPFTTSYDVKGSGSFDIDIKSSTLHGHVLDASTGEPLADAHIELHSTSGDAIMSTRGATTASDGTFVIDSVARGNYQIKADRDGYGHELKSIVVGDSNDEIELKLASTSGVTLTVVDARDNTPLAASVVRVVDAQGQNVDTTGFLRFGGTPEPVKLPLAAGTYRVTVAAMNYATQTFAVVSPSSPTVRMSPGGTLLIRSKASTMTRARLIDASGLPYTRGFMGGGGGIFTIDPSPGVTTLQNVAPGSFNLQILGPGDQVVKTVPVTVIDGQTVPVDVE